MTDFTHSTEMLRQKIEDSLHALFTLRTADCPEPLLSAMRHSLFAGGKHVRAVLLYQTTGMFGKLEEDAMVLACALEMIHTASLIHDDMPSMDNDTIRRGRRTCHVVYGEGQALLAGDSLLNMAYEAMLLHTPKPENVARYYEACGILAHAAGNEGMCGGQCLDLAFSAKDSASLDTMNRMKTGALLQAAVEAGAVLGGANAAQRTALVNWADCYGRLFQITDDILDVTGVDIGKSIGKDARDDKHTYVTLMGLVAAQKEAKRLADEAIKVLQELPQTDSRDYLHLLTAYTVNRKV